MGDSVPHGYEFGYTSGNWTNAPLFYVHQLDRLWNARLQARYRDRRALETAWQGDLGPYEDPAIGSVRRLRPDHFAGAGAARFREEAQFYTDIEMDYFHDMSAYLRRDLGAQQLILGTSDHNHGWSALPLLEANATLDVMDGHFYWQHPRSRRPGAITGDTTIGGSATRRWSTSRMPR